MLWILSPSASPTLMERIGGKSDPLWPEGVYFAADVNRTGFVAIDRLLEISDTLWLRLLGRGRALDQEIAELLALSPEEPKRNKAVQLLASWKTNIESIEELEAEDRELVMALSPAFVEWERQTRQAGVEEGTEQTWWEAIVDALTTRFGVTVPQSVASSLDGVRDLDDLKALFKQAIAVSSLEEFQQLLSGKVE